MDCREFADRIGEAASAGSVAGVFAEHARTCPDCAAMLARARTIARAAQALSPEPFPDDLDVRIRRAAFGERAPWPRMLIRAAAALLLLGGLGVVVFGLPGRGYRPLDLVIVDVDANGAADEDLALEHIFGPPRASAPRGGEDDR